MPKSVTPRRIEENLKVVPLVAADKDLIAKSCEGKRQRYCDFSEISMSLQFHLLGMMLNDQVGYKYYDGLDDTD